MKRLSLTFLAVLMLVSLFGVSSATNGDNLISIGPVSRSMGGVGIAAPQDAISAVFSNPAAMCFGPYCPGSGFDFSGSIFMPQAHTRITIPAFGLDTGRQRSDSDIFIIPAIGVSAPINPNLRFGLAAYGVSGLGVDYREKFDLDPATPGNQAVYTNLQVMKFAPNLAYMVSPNFSIGAAIHVNYGALDLGDGTSSGFGIGGQVGAIYKTGPFQLGAVYVTPQSVKHKRVANFDAAFGSTTLDDLKLQSPQSLGVGAAMDAIPGKLLVETNLRWLNWGDAKGYKDFDWKDQWVWSLGAQYKVNQQFTLRAGVNYANNPVKTNALDGASPPIMVQGKAVPQFQYEVLRVSGFPAIVQTHIAFGLGYNITKNVTMDLGFTHAFKKTLNESGTATFPNGQGGFVTVPATIQADLQENSIDFGITWRF